MRAYLGCSTVLLRIRLFPIQTDVQALLVVGMRTWHCTYDRCWWGTGSSSRVAVGFICRLGSVGRLCTLNVTPATRTWGGEDGVSATAQLSPVNAAQDA